MSEATMQVQIPAALLKLGLDHDEVERRVVEWLVLSLFTDGHISSGKAARLLNVTRLDFLALLRLRGIAYVNYSAEELADEIAAARALPDEPGQ